MSGKLELSRRCASRWRLGGFGVFLSHLGRPFEGYCMLFDPHRRSSLSRHEFRTLMSKCNLREPDLRELDEVQILIRARDALTPRELRAFMRELEHRGDIEPQRECEQDLMELFLSLRQSAKSRRCHCNSPKLFRQCVVEFPEAPLLRKFRSEFSTTKVNRTVDQSSPGQTARALHSSPVASGELLRLISSQFWSSSEERKHCAPLSSGGTG
jgi:hypothetical protein